MSDPAPRVPVHTWVTIVIVVAGLISNWALMTYQIEQHGNVLENLQDNTIRDLMHDLRESREEIDDLQIRAATEDAADRLMEIRIERLEDAALRKY